MNIVEILFFALFIGILLLVNYFEKFNKLRNLFFNSFIFIGVVFSILCFASLIGGLMFEKLYLFYTIIFFILSMLSFILYSEKFREIIIKFFRFNLNPKSAVHSTALFLFFIAIIVLIPFYIFLEGYEKNYENLNIEKLIMYDLFYVLVALSGCGIFVRKNFKEIIQYLGLKKPSLREIFIGISVSIGLIFLSSIIELIFQILFNQPQESEEWIKNLITLPNIFIIGIGAGISEEILFRGAMQPKFGILFTSILFALGHVQYTFFGIFILFIISIILGYLRRLTNTTTTIITHSFYDIILMIMLFLTLPR